MGVDAAEEARSLAGQGASIEGDGVAVQLFELLWKRDLRSHSSLTVSIPDTVVFRFDFVSGWYFTSVDGTVKRKTRAKLTNDSIYEEFTKRPTPSGVVAYFVATGPRSTESGRTSKPTVEYFGPEGLRDFLFNCPGKGDGILQRFIEPKGEKNSMMRALWSPKVCVLERRVNRLSLRDARYNAYERVVTFEGPEFKSESAPVRGSAMVAKVHEIADGIVHHVAGVTHDSTHISRLALNFKVDAKDRLWLLFASSVRLRGPLPLRASQADSGCRPLEADAMLRVPEHAIPLVQASRSSGPVPVHRLSCCPTCEQHVEDDCLFDVSYKMLVEGAEGHRRASRSRTASREARAVQAAQDEDSDKAVGSRMPRLSSAPELRGRTAVPAVMRQLHPRLTSDEFCRLREDVAFLSRTIPVCEDCFLHFTSLQLGEVSFAAAKRRVAEASPRLDGREAEEENAMASFVEDIQYFGTQDLDPERLRRRRSLTRHRINEMRAAEDEEERPIPAATAPARSQSCPKLPHWGRSHSHCHGPDPGGAPPRPPGPGLGGQLQLLGPPPPRCAPPRGLPRGPPPRPWSAEDARSPSQSSRGPPARQPNPYLKELQAFAAYNGRRAMEVLGPCAVNQAMDEAKRSPRVASAAGLTWCRCQTCGLVFESFAALNNHSKKMHGIKAEVPEPACKASRRPPATEEHQQVPSKSSASRPPPLSNTATTLAGSCAGTATTHWNDTRGRAETPTTAPPLSRRPSARSSSFQTTSRPSSGLPGSRPPSGGPPGSRSAHSRARAEMLQRAAEVLRNAPASTPLAAAAAAGSTAPPAAAAS